MIAELKASALRVGFGGVGPRFSRGDSVAELFSGLDLYCSSPHSGPQIILVNF